MMLLIPDLGPCGFRSFDASNFVRGGDGIREKIDGSFFDDSTLHHFILHIRKDRFRLRLLKPV